jgi:hypothetical protein
VTFDLYAWKSPRDLDADGVRAMLSAWEDAGGDPATSPFEPSTDVGWFFRELTKDEPELDATSDALPNTSTGPLWLTAPPDPPPARVVRIPVSPAIPRDLLGSIYGLAAKYDLVLYDTRSGAVHLPLDEMAAHASATFWPGGAIQAALAGGAGLVIAIVAWLIGIPVLSGIAILIGMFLFAGAVYTFIHEGRKRLKARRTG